MKAVFFLLLVLNIVNCLLTPEGIFQIPVEDYDDNLYLIKISVGSPPQNFTVQLDTASSDAWLVDSTCESTQCKGKLKPKNRYNSISSKTFNEDGHEFLVEYSHKGVQGKVAQDTMTISELKLEKQSFGRGLLLDQSFGTLPIDGILGFGLEKSSQTGLKSPLQTIFELLNQKSMTLWLDSHASSKKLGGMLTFGGTDPDNCETNWTYTNLTSSFFWAMDVSKFTFGSFVVDKRIQAVMSTRDTYINVPSKIYQKIISSLNATKIDPYDFYGISCDKVGDAPDLKFEIEGKTFLIEKTEYIRKIKLSGEKCVVFIDDSSKKGPDNQFVLGDGFLRSYCTNYSLKSRQIGLAKAKHDQ